MTSIYKNYTTDQLREFAQMKTPTPIHLVLDRDTIDYLLSLNTNNRRMSQKCVGALISSINKIGWKTTESFCVTESRQLADGQHRLVALQQLGYPENICATVIFGANTESILANHNMKSTKSPACERANASSN